jgi:hypothetical protein
MIDGGRRNRSGDRVVAKTTRTEIKVVGISGQISIGKRYAGKTFELERLDDGTVVIRPVSLVPER